MINMYYLNKEYLKSIIIMYNKYIFSSVVH